VDLILQILIKITTQNEKREGELVQGIYWWEWGSMMRGVAARQMNEGKIHVPSFVDSSIVIDIRSNAKFYTEEQKNRTEPPFHISLFRYENLARQSKLIIVFFIHNYYIHIL
jgi:hypothetical protein